MQDNVDIILIHTRNKAYSRVYAGKCKIDISKYQLPLDSWIYRLMGKLAEISRVDPLHTSKIHMFRSALDVSIGSQDARNYLELTIQNLSSNKIRAMFDLVEGLLDKLDCSASTKYKMSQEFRSVTLMGIRMFDEFGHLNKSTVGYKTRLQYRRAPREMISDFVDALDSNASAGVIGAISFSDVKDLHQKTYDKLMVDLDKIINACITELEWHEKVRKEFNRCLALSISPDFVDLVRRLLRGSFNKGVLALVLEESKEKVLSAILAVIDEDRLAFADREYTPNFEWAIPVKSALLDSVGFHLHKSEHFYLLGSRLASSELRAIFNLLLCYTGWNAGALIGMEVSEVNKIGAYYVIRGFKSKTDDYTPPFHLDKYCRYGVKSLEKLIWNRESLIEHGLLSDSSTNFWYGWTKSFERVNEQSIGLFMNNTWFSARHGLPNYSYDQIRTQVMSLGIIQSNGNIDAVRREAGHFSSVTTAKYLDQPIFRRIASSVNFDFQKKLESTVVWDLVESGEMNYDGSTIDVTRRLKLIPIGDGASCISPTTPPAGNATVNGLCLGDRCHKDSGCENRVVNINVAALESLILKKRYFQNNWQRLYLANSYKFESVLAPAMLFNFALYEFISTSKFSGVLRKLEKEMGV